jgi:hypothetical protein
VRSLALLSALPLLGALVGGRPVAHAATPPTSQQAELGYDGRFEFVRIRYGNGQLGFGREPTWAHDYNRGAERHLATILDELTYIRPHIEGKIFTLDDPALFHYPIAYIVEVGFWTPTEAEVQGLRSYLLKGGFLIVDDFRGAAILNFQEQMQRVLPGLRLLPVETTNSIWDSFFYIRDPHALAAPPIYDPREVPEYFGYFENDDPRGRIMVIVNHNQDLSEYWEFSAQGLFPIDPTNEAYKFGVNYMIYAMTH